MEYVVKSAFILAVLLASSCSAALLDKMRNEISVLLNAINTQPRISGGAEARLEEFPYQVAILAKNTATLRCGGALVGENFVLTSAYCANLGNSSTTQVMVGNTVLTRESPSQIVDVENILVHQNYTLEDRYNDLAILKLRRSLSIRQPSVDVIKVKTSAISEGTECTFTGWGAEAWNGAVSRQLKKLHLTILVPDDCNAQLGQNITADQICAVGQDNSNACFLDEGGPLVCGGEVTGILSHSVNCGRENKPSVYASVASHRRWIEDIIYNGSPINSFSCFTMLLAMLAGWSSRL